MIADYFKLALSDISHRRLRSWLTMVGVFVGIMAVVALVSLGDGLENTINKEFEKIGGNRIIIAPGGGGAMAALASVGGGLGTVKLYERDVDAVKEVRGIEYAVGVLTRSVKVVFAGETKYSTVFCIPAKPEDIKFLEETNMFVAEKGGMLKDGDRHKTVVGYSMTQDFFDRKVGPKDKINIGGGEFEVVGVTKKSGSPAHDEKVVLTRETCKELFNMTEDEVTAIQSTVKEGFDVTEVAEDVKKKLRKEHNVKEDEEDFTVATAQEIMRTFMGVINMIQFAVTGIAAISLLVGGLGIMTTMYTSVLERTKQIGIMKAVGARKSDILAIFLIESGLLGLVGGLIGITLGLGLAKIVEYIAVFLDFRLLTVSVSFPLLAGAMFFAFIVGSIFGVMPALQAAKLNPTEAIRKY